MQIVRHSISSYPHRSQQISVNWGCVIPVADREIQNFPETQMALSHAHVPGLSARFAPPLINDPITAADIGNSTAFVHILKRAKCEQ